MSKSPSKDPEKLLRDETGQATSEYAFVAFWAVLVVVLTFNALRFALFDYYQDAASLICLPIP